MTRIARKITRGKWSSGDWGSLERIPADAISIDLKTSGNTLSVWEVEDTEEGLDRAILAILGTQDRVDSIDLLIIHRDELARYKVIKTEGKTFPKLANLHYDISDLDGIALHATAQVFGKHIYNDNFTRITRTQFINRIIDGIQKSYLSLDELKEKVRDEVTKKLP